MKNCILHILCEGETEENFVKKILAPYLHSHYIYAKPILLCTSRKKQAAGGAISFTQLTNDLNRVLASIRRHGRETHIVTTMLDFYALPTDFPGRDDALKCNDPYAAVNCIEQAMEHSVGHRCFIPYVQLHEFEALLFADISKLAADYPKASKEIDALQASACKIGNPELINHGADTAPSKRIINCLKSKYRYDKVRSGAGVAAAITLPVIMSRCSHFNQWVEHIIALSDKL